MRPPSCDLQGDGCEPARRRAAEHATGARLEDGAMARALEASAHGGPDDGAAEVRTAALEGDATSVVVTSSRSVGDGTIRWLRVRTVWAPNAKRSSGCARRMSSTSPRVP